MLLVVDDERDFRLITSIHFRELLRLPQFSQTQAEILQKYWRKHTLVRDYNQFVDYLNSKEWPQMIMFDHDLGPGLSGMDCLKYACDYCLDNNLPVFEAYFHSANPIGRKNMESYYKSFLINIVLLDSIKSCLE